MTTQELLRRITLHIKHTTTQKHLINTIDNDTLSRLIDTATDLLQEFCSLKIQLAKMQTTNKNTNNA
jgi:hypothetical protein